MSLRSPRRIRCVLVTALLLACTWPVDAHAEAEIGALVEALYEGSNEPRCASRVETVNSRSTIRCGDRQLACRIVHAGNFAPTEGNEFVQSCDARLVITSTRGDVLADLGDVPFIRVESASFTRSALSEILITASSGDWGYIHLLRWSNALGGFALILRVFNAWMVASTEVSAPRVLDQPGAPATIEACEGTFTWDAARERYQLARRRLREPPACRDD